MGIFTSLFGRKTEDTLKPICGSLLNVTHEIVNEIERNAYHNEKVLFFQTYAEVYSSLLHYLSRVSLHVGGAAFQDSVYSKVKVMMIDFFVGIAMKSLSISPKVAELELNDLYTKREIEYSKHSVGYADLLIRKESLIWAMARNIHIAAKISVANEEEVISNIGNILVSSLASIGLDKQLEGYKQH